MSETPAKSGIAAWIPGLRTLTAYQRSNLGGDITAGLVVALVVIPSAIAYADLAHCPPIAGLYAALGGMIAFALFTSSRHVIAGPDAAIAILVGATVAPLAGDDPGKAVALSTWLALLAAIILLFAGWLKLGGVAEFLSSPVMLGFMNGAAVVIIASQIGKLFGIHLKEENTLQKLWEWLTRLGETHWLTLLCGLIGIGILVGMRYWWPKVPGTIMVFALGLLAGRLFDFSSAGMTVIGVVDTRIPSPVPPELALADIGRLVTGALGLALLIFPEGILLGRAMAERHKYEIDANQELVALGMANLATGVLRSFSVGGSQSRTLLNSATGGHTQLVSIVASVILVGFMFFLASWIATLPTAAIAAILVYTGITLIDINANRRLLAQHRFSGIVAIITSLGVIALGVLPAIMVGIVLSLLNVISRISRPHDALLARPSGSEALHDVGDDESATTIPGLVVYRFYGPLIFANVRYFIERLEHYIARETIPVRQIILDARAIPEIDVTAVEQLRIYIQNLGERGIHFVIAKAHLPFRETARSLGATEAFADVNYFAKVSEAVAQFEQQRPMQD